MKRSPALAAAGVATLVFLYLPILILIVFSFNASRYGAAWHGFTLDWYRRLLENKSILASTENSLLIASCACVLSTLLGTLAAVAQGRFAWKRLGLLEGMFFLPIVIPELMMAIGFLLFFGLIGLRQGLGTLIVAHTTFDVPIVWLVVRARLKKLDPRLEDAAMDLGATRWMAFRKVTLPLLAPAILGGALMAFAISLDDFFISFFVSGPESTTLPVQIYSMLKFSIDPQVNALSAALFVASMSLVVLAWVLQGGESHAH
ncbi:MAG TPA: ABC transporter permease [Elusimicrobiota bacterium]|jgi:spermidine/putrescine transport system permease protein|nr:ABC transporter permease [Elusimicrobiota bacterium]